MGCLVVLFGFITPRFVIVMLWLFTDYMSRAYGGWLLPTLGFFFLPTTTIAYAIAQNSIHSQLGRTIVVVFGVLIDVGVFGKGRGVAKDRGRRREPSS
jgi:putative effector of murein hydrolase LrgA (UPF0299 family)